MSQQGHLGDGSAKNDALSPRSHYEQTQKQQEATRYLPNAFYHVGTTVHVTLPSSLPSTQSPQHVSQTTGTQLTGRSLINHLLQSFLPLGPLFTKALPSSVSWSSAEAFTGVKPWVTEPGWRTVMSVAPLLLASCLGDCASACWPVLSGASQ